MRGHWDRVFSTRADDELSWSQREPATSIRLLAMACPGRGPVVDIGSGLSGLGAALVADGWTDVTILDIAEEALATQRHRLAGTGATVRFVVADVLEWEPDRLYQAWHDRAVFHFLVDPADRGRYVARAASAVAPGGGLVIGTFAADGPVSCSGLPTARYDAADLAAEFASAFALEHDEREEHVTPAGYVQPFTWVVLRRR